METWWLKGLRPLFVVLILLPVFLSNRVCAQSNPARSKRALLIAISDYPKETGWVELSSDKDVALVKPALERQGFTDITLLRNPEATRQGIVKAIQELTLKSGNGDVVVIHYSGHGQQISDDNNEEVDGLDETLVAYGAPQDYYEGYQGEKHVRDDEFGEWIERLRRKVAPDGQVIAFIDACNSGTATRGSAKVRGSKPMLFPKMLARPGKQPEKGMGLDLAASKSRGGAGAVAPYVIYSAASFDEPDYETEDDNGHSVGPLSYAVAKVLSNLDANMTYQGLFFRLLEIMNTKVPNQSPAVEGNTDYQLFGGQWVKQEKYYTVNKVVDDLLVEVNMGKIIGVFDSTRVGLYPSGIANRTGKPLVMGTVVKADHFSSLVKLDNLYSLRNKNAYWVFIEQQSFGEMETVVDLEGLTDKAVKDSLSRALSQVGYVKVKPSVGRTRGEKKKKEGAVENWEADLTIQNQPAISRGAAYLLVNTSADGLRFDSVRVASVADVERVVEVVKAYSQSNFLKKLHMQATGMDVEMQLLHCHHCHAPDGKYVLDTLGGQSEIAEFVARQDSAKMKIINKGSERIYFNIIDIQPNGVINPILPTERETNPENGRPYFVEPHSSKIIPGIIQFSPPYGNEVFKVIASKAPFNLVPIITTKGKTRSVKGVRKPFEILFQDTYQATRGGGYDPLSVDEGVASYNFVFKIVPPLK